MMFVEGTLGDIKKHHHLFEQLSSTTNSENILSKKRTGKNDFTPQNNAAKLFLNSADSLRIATKGEKTLLSYKMSKIRILAWSPIFAWLLGLSLPLTIEGIHSIIFSNDYWLLNFSAFAALWIVPFVPALILSVIGYFAPGGSLPVRMSRVVIDMSDSSITWEHRSWPRFFTKKETIKLPVNMSFDSGFYTYFDES